MELLLLATIFLSMTMSGLSQSETNCSENFPAKDQFSTDREVKYLLPDVRRRTGYLIIVPEMSFSCHGYITGWSALTRFSANDLAIDQLYHDITFDLWRPTPGVNGSYTFVGSKRLDFFGQTLRAGMSVVNGTQFFKFESAIVHGPLLHFQPGDVIGWYLHSLVQSTDNALTVVYKEQSAIASNQLATSSRPVDMYCTEIENAKSKARPPCELSILSDQTVVIPSVIPYINVDYVSTDGPPKSRRVGTCIDTTRR